MKFADKQYLFNAVWNGLKSQGFEQCKLNGATMTCIGDKRDACGWLARKGSKVPSNPYLLYEQQDKKIRPLVLDLMGAHDAGNTPEGMERNLRMVAMRHGLKVPE